MKKPCKAAQEWISQLEPPDWGRLLTVLAPVAVRFVTNWLLDKSAAYSRAREKEAEKGSKKKKLISLAPSSDYVQGLLDDLMARQEIWIHEGKSQVEVLCRTIGWGFVFLWALVHRTWDNVRLAAQREGQNSEG